MCCLFGLLDYSHSLTTAEKNHILSVLAAACEARGIDATGIAYNSRGTLHIFKRPVPGHTLRFHVPADAWTIMGHTRMTTQGNAKRNRNNHPFIGKVENDMFALAHNGVLYNDHFLRCSLGLPWTKIETDSYIAVQLIEQKNSLDFDSLRYMAEQIEGSFTFTVLDQQNNLYIVRGDNPMCLCHFPAMGLYLYASTEEILNQVMAALQLPFKKAKRIELCCGEILKIDKAGKLSKGRFDNSDLAADWYNPLWPYHGGFASHDTPVPTVPQKYLEEIKSVACYYGYTPEQIENLAAKGFSAEELEEFLYCGAL